jgi:hypothetical protein
LPRVLIILLGAAFWACASPNPEQHRSASASERRTAIDAKIDSQLLQAIRRAAGDTKDLPLEPPLVDIDRSGRALVDIRADVSDPLIASIRKLRGRIVTTSVPLHSIIARIPLNSIRSLAEDAAVRFIAPTAEATTHRRRFGP